MIQNQSLLPLGKIMRVAGLASLGVALNYLFNRLKNSQYIHQSSSFQIEKRQKQKERNHLIIQKGPRWGKFRIQNIPQGDDLLIELKMLSSLTGQIQKIPNLIIDLQYTEFKTIKNPIVAQKIKQKKQQPYMNPKSLAQPGCFIINNAQIKTGQLLSFSKKWLRGGARKTIYFNPTQVCAAIVTCGGLCPGINTLIKQLVVCLSQNYKVPTIYGFKYSFKGMIKYDWIQLNPQLVKVIHHYGGSYLGINRQMPNIQQIVQKLVQKKINQIYVIGGEGSLRLTSLLYENLRQKKINIAICNLAKSITNDLPIFDKSFGFQTALEETQRAIQAAYVESHSHQNGVGIVKVLGKKSGFLAMQSCLAARNVHVCLVPQFGFQVYGQYGLFNYILKRLTQRGHCLIVIAQGCTQSVKDLTLKTIGTQWNGQPQKQDIGLVIKRQLMIFLSKKNINFSVKYIDPTYMIRAVPANAFDTKMCCQIAQSGIHGLMAGYTGFASGHVINKNVMIPINQMLSGNYSNRILSHSPEWQRLLATTGQPSFRNHQYIQ